MVRTPQDALARLRSMADDGSLGELCERLGVELLVAHGSAVRTEGVAAPRDLDLAYRSRAGAGTDIVTVIGALVDATRFDGIDLMDIARAGDVAKARALGPQSVLLYEAAPSTFALAQIAALTTEMESRFLRRRDLELMAGR